MESNYEWVCSNGIVLEGEEAIEYLSHKLTQYKNLVSTIDSTLVSCIHFNQILEEETLPQTILSTGESLSLLQIQLEMLLTDIRNTLENY